MNKGFWRPGSQALFIYRFGVWQIGLRPSIAKSVAGRSYNLLRGFVRNFYGIELYASARIGRRLYIPHQSAIVLHPELIMGVDCMIRHSVTIGFTGSKPRGGTEVRRGPTIGDRVEIGVGAVIIGPITVGNDVKIGPNTVVMRSVPDGSLVTVAPPRVMRLSPPPVGNDVRDAGNESAASGP